MRAPYVCTRGVYTVLKCSSEFHAEGSTRNEILRIRVRPNSCRHPRFRKHHRGWTYQQVARSPGRRFPTREWAGRKGGATEDFTDTQLRAVLLGPRASTYLVRETHFVKLRNLMRRLNKDERGITGLETAIILIAFVVVATVSPKRGNGLSGVGRSSVFIVS